MPLGLISFVAMATCGVCTKLSLPLPQADAYGDRPLLLLCAGVGCGTCGDWSHSAGDGAAGEGRSCASGVGCGGGEGTGPGPDDATGTGTGAGTCAGTGAGTDELAAIVITAVLALAASWLLSGSS